MWQSERQAKALTVLPPLSGINRVLGKIQIPVVPVLQSESVGDGGHYLLNDKVQLLVTIVIQRDINRAMN